MTAARTATTATRHSPSTSSAARPDPSTYHVTVCPLGLLEEIHRSARLAVGQAMAADHPDAVVHSLDNAEKALSFAPTRVEPKWTLIRLQRADGGVVWRGHWDGDDSYCKPGRKADLEYLGSAKSCVLNDLAYQADRRTAQLTGALVSSRVSQDPATYSAIVDSDREGDFLPNTVWATRLRMLAAITSSQSMLAYGHDLKPVRDVLEDATSSAASVAEPFLGKFPVGRPPEHTTHRQHTRVVIESFVASKEASDQASDRFTRRWGLAIAQQQLGRSL